MKDLDYQLKTVYSKQVMSLKCERKSEYVKLCITKKRTSTGRKILVFQIAVIIIMLCILAVGAVAGMNALSQVIYDKTANTNLSDENKQDIMSRLEGINMSADELEKLPDYQANENGLSYGTYFLGADLFTVAGSDESGDITGYCYRDDLTAIDGTDLHTLDEIVSYSAARENETMRNWIYVYEEDGKTVIGKYIIKPVFSYTGDLTEEEADALFDEWIAEHDKPGSKYGFVTNKDLESIIIQAEIINGTDGEEYKKMAKERSEMIGD